MAAVKITISGSGWNIPISTLYYNKSGDRAFYSDSSLYDPVDMLPLPTRECYAFSGCYLNSSDSSWGDQLIDESGNILQALKTAADAASTSLTIYVKGEKTAWTITLDDNGGSGGMGAFYRRISDGEFFATSDLSGEPLEEIKPLPIKSGFAFAGYFANKTSSRGDAYVTPTGRGTETLAALNSDVTIYAWYESALVINVLPNGGRGGSNVVYFNPENYGYHLIQDLSDDPTFYIVPHVRDGFRLIGYYPTKEGRGYELVRDDGFIVEEIQNYQEIFAVWALTTYIVTVSKNGGNGGTDRFFAGAETEIVLPNVGLFADSAANEPLDVVSIPFKTGFVCTGLWTESTGGMRIFEDAGNATSFAYQFAVDVAYVRKTNVTVYARYTKVHRITLSVNVSGRTDKLILYYSEEDRKYYYDARLTDEIVGGKIRQSELPTRELFRFCGYWSSAAGGTQLIDSIGTIVADAPTSDATWYARWVRKSYRIRLSANGGSPDRKFYHDGSSAAFFADDDLTEPVTSVEPPVRDGYDFTGAWTSVSGGDKVVNADGSIHIQAVTATDNMIYARWSPLSYTLTFDYNGGRGMVPSKSVRMGNAVGELPDATYAFGKFEGWFIGDTKIESNLIWNFAADNVAVARWFYYFGNLTDFFQLETANGPLMLVASNSGATRTVIETSNTGALAIQSGDSSVGAFKTFGMLMNPVCTYRVRKEGRVTINLGAAWAGSGTTKSGYMLVSAEYATAADGEPVLVVRGAANEGAPAINRWSVNLDVNPDHIAQDPMNAVNGGGELTECKTLVTCDPVVPMENGMPCASDIVHGKVIVTATTNAYGGENAPTARSPFIETNGVPPDESDIDFTTYALTAEKSL